MTSKLAAILTSFSAGEEYGLTELARRTGLPMSTAHRLIGELVDRDLLVRGADGGFRVGTALRSLTEPGAAVPTLRERAAFVVTDVAEALGRRSRIGVLDDLQVAYVEKTPGYQPATPFAAGARLPAHATALGKALLAFGPSGVLTVVLRSPLPAYTRRTLHDPDGLRRALHEVRRSGCAVDRGELQADRCGVAVPVRGATGPAVAAIEVEVEPGELSPVRLAELMPALLVAARALGRELRAGRREQPTAAPPVPAAPARRGA